MTEEQEVLVMRLLIQLTRDWGIVDEVIFTIECRFCRTLRYWDWCNLEDAFRRFDHKETCTVLLGRRLRQTIKEQQEAQEEATTTAWRGGGGV